ncbi:hypothetical protein [[Clostridium] colinum]|uniref:hypothetical protein n=1 Tax=[Clostridium] colinum TaxID=36835 RepID=UPI0020245BE0|nr:hypothetical protein [[Clostridium] colinum]
MGDFKKLTLETLLDRKSRQDKMGLSTLDIDSLNSSIPIVKIKTRKILEIIDKYKDNDAEATSSYDMMCETIYKSVPILQERNLKEQLNVPTPYEVVGELFDFDEMEKIYTHIMDLHGMTDKTQTSVDDEIKN